MAFGFRQSKDEADPTLTFDTTPLLGGPLVFGFRWEGATGSDNMIGTQNTSGLSVVMGTRVDNAGGDHHAQMGYILTPGVASGDQVINLTFPAAAVLREVCFAEFTTTDTPTLDTQNTGSGASGTALASGSVTLNATAANWLAVAWASSYSGGQAYSGRLINAVAQDGFEDSVLEASYGTMFWRFLTSAFAAGNAVATASVGDAWILNILALKAGTGGAPPDLLNIPGRRIFVLP